MVIWTRDGPLTSEGQTFKQTASSHYDDVSSNETIIEGSRRGLNFLDY